MCVTDINTIRPVVVLTPEQEAEGEEVGRGRRQYAIEHSRTPGGHLDASNETALRIDIVGACGEKAIHTLFPTLPWHKEIVRDVSDLPDIGDFIDVKTPDQRPDKPPRSLIHYKGGVKLKWAYVLVLPIGDRRYRVMGWVWGDELARAPIKELSPGRPSHVLPPTIPPLRHIKTLQAIVAAAQAQEIGKLAYMARMAA